MIDALDRDCQSPLLSDRDESLFAQIPFVKFKMLVRAVQHILEDRADNARVCGVFTPSLVEDHQYLSMLVRVGERSILADVDRFSRIDGLSDVLGVGCVIFLALTRIAKGPVRG